MAQVYNLVVELDERFGSPPMPPPGIEIRPLRADDDRLLAWVDEQFGGSWSCEVRAGSSVFAWRGERPIGFAAFDARGLRFRWLRGLARDQNVGLFGPFGVVASERGSDVGTTLLHSALHALATRGYARALIAAVADQRLIAYYARTVDARIAECFERSELVSPAVRAVMLASGNGTNVQAVIDGVRAGTLPIDPVALVVNADRAGAIARAHAAGIAVRTVQWNRSDESRKQYDGRLLATVAGLRPDMVLLLGWMHLLDAAFVRAFDDVLNIHPAFLPLDPHDDDVAVPDGTRIAAFRGPFAVRDALASASRWVGATVHEVTAATDRGPVIVRKPLRVEPDETQPEVMARLHPLEHQLVAAGIMRRVYERA